MQFETGTADPEILNERSFHVQGVHGYCANRCRQEDKYNGG